jgi:predicted hydrocarbon binding protein
MDVNVVLKSFEDIIFAMDSAIKEFWKTYSGMMVSVGRVFGNEAVKRCLSEDVEGLLKELEDLIPMKFKVEGDRIVVERCIVRDLMEKGIIDKDNTMCPFLKGFISKVFESIGIKAVCENCEVKIG